MFVRRMMQKRGDKVCSIKIGPARRKLSSKAGETIAETLVALLISALALVMLAGAISTTAKVINTSDKKMGKYYEQDANLAARDGKGGTTINIIIKDVTTGNKVEEHEVSPAKNEAFASKPVVAYKTANTVPAGD